MLTLALDQSTSATKAILIDENGGILDREAREHQQHYPRPGWVEHDAEEIWQNTLETIRKLLSRHSHRLNELESLAITNQRETVVVFDKEFGHPLHRAMVWQCRRGEERCRELSEKGHEELVHLRTGLKIDPYFSASKIDWILRNRSDIRDQIIKGSAAIGTIDCYLVHRLTCGAVFATDTTNASRTLLFNITTLTWDRELCDLWGIPLHALPEIRDSSACFGITDLDGLLTRPIPIRGVLGDSHASLLAHGCTETGDAKVTFGTGSSILLNIGAHPRFSKSGVLTTLAWTHGGLPTYAFEGIIVSSASTLTWLRDQMGIAPDVETLEKAAQTIETSEGVYLVPAFSGLGLPYWRPEARALITGLSAQSNQCHIARAAFESIALQLQAALAAMSAEAGAKLLTLKADGGPTASAFLMKLCADISMVNLESAPASDMSALGAARAGRMGIEAKDSRPPNAEQRRRTYRPSMPEASIRALVEGWNHAVSLAISNRPMLKDERRASGPE